MLIPLHVALGRHLAEQMRGDLQGRQLALFRHAWAVLGLPGFIVIALGAALVVWIYEAVFGAGDG